MPGAGLRHATAIRVVVIADEQRIEPGGTAPPQRSGCRPTARDLASARHVGLVGDAQSSRTPHPAGAAPARARPPARRARPRDAGGYGCAVAHDGIVQHAVAIEKDGRPRPAVMSYFPTDSHFVSCALSAGCETSRCQTTAWNASACGVVWTGLTVGTMHARVGDLRGVAAIAADDADDAGADGLRLVQRGHEVRADVLLDVAAADREHAAPRRAPPGGWSAATRRRPMAQPSSLVRAVSSDDVVGRRVGLDADDLPEVVDGVRGVGGAAADAQDEQPSAAARATSARSAAARSIAGRSSRRVTSRTSSRYCRQRSWSLPSSRSASVSRRSGPLRPRDRQKVACLLQPLERADLVEALVHFVRRQSPAGRRAVSRARRGPRPRRPAPRRTPRADRMPRP